MMARRVMAGRSGFSPKALFAAGEQGVWYDPSDFSTLFQDAAGTTPVTAVEQPVGLMLDKSKGLVLGPELVTNGDFGSGTTGWTVGTNWVISGGSAVATAAVYNTNNLDQSISFVSGRTYKLTFSISNYSAGSLRVDIVGYQTVVGGGITANGSYQFFFVAAVTNPTSILRITGGTSTAFSGSVDNISVRELPGNHAFQTTSANRPTLSARYNLLTKTEQFDDAAWVKLHATVTANAVTAPDGTSTADLILETATTDFHEIYTTSPITLIVGSTYTVSVNVKPYSTDRYLNLSGSFGDIAKAFSLRFDPATNTLSSIYIESACISGASAKAAQKENGFYTVSVTFTATATNTSLYCQCALTNTMDAPASSSFGLHSYAGNASKGIYIWGADLRVANDGVSIPAYQRVNTATDYDTVGFPPYLAFNGSTQSLQTNPIDFSSTDKVLVAAGVRKLSDAATGVLTELSASIDTNNGVFVVGAPGGSLPLDRYIFVSKGTAPQFAHSGNQSVYYAPVTNTLTGLGDISGDRTTLRVNGSQAAQSTADQGTGNYGNYPLYIGARGGSSMYFNGHLYSLIVRGAQTPANLIAATERYIARKTGVTL